MAMVFGLIISCFVVFHFCLTLPVFVFFLCFQCSPVFHLFKVKLSPKCNLGFFCECIWVQTSRESAKKAWSEWATGVSVCSTAKHTRIVLIETPAGNNCNHDLISCYMRRTEGNTWRSCLCCWVVAGVLPLLTHQLTCAAALTTDLTAVLFNRSILTWGDTRRKWLVCNGSGLLQRWHSSR